MQKQTSTPPPQPETQDDRHVVVCGLGRFGLKIVARLRERGVPVVVITDDSTRKDRKARAWEMKANLVEGDFRFPEVRLAARTDEARAVILASSSDQANLETALDLKKEHPTGRVVMRLESDTLAERLQSDFGIDAVLSPPVLAAREFTKAALDPPPAPRSASLPVRRLPRRLAAPGRLSVRAFPFILAWSLVGLFASGVLVFHYATNLKWMDAAYFTAAILSTVGFGDFNLHDEPSGVKVFGILLMFGGVVLIAALSSLLTNYFLSGAADQRRSEQAAAQMRDQVILCGLGSVGFEIAERLIAQKVRLVIVDATPDDAHARNLTARVPLLIGDATQPDTLRRAGIHRARAVIAAVSSDAINLEIGLVAQSLVEESRPHRPLRLVLRCFDPDLADRIHARSDAYTLLSSAEIAAPIFADAALKNSE